MAGSGKDDVQTALPSAWERRRRRLHIVDIENLVGPEHAAGDRFGFAHALSDYARTIDMGDDDPVMLGCHPGLVFVANEVLGARGQIFTGRGTDGADLALLDAVDPDFVVSRFHLVGLGSGDHIFAPLVRHLAAAAVPVTVVGRGGRISRELADAAAEVRILGDTPVTGDPTSSVA
jgi:hypothetical protein